MGMGAGPRPVIIAPMERLLPPNSPEPDPIQREDDARRMRQLRSAIALLAAVLWAALAWLVVALVVPRGWWADMEGRLGDGRLSIDHIVGLVLALVWCMGVVPLWLQAGPPRWQTHAAGLVALAAVDCGLILGRMTNAAPGHEQLLGVVGDTLGWVELWLLAVVLAELGVTVGDEPLIRLAERTGPVLLFGVVCWLALMSHFDWAQDKLMTDNADGTPSSQAALLGLASLVLSAAAIYLSARAASRASLLASRQLGTLDVEA